MIVPQVSFEFFPPKSAEDTFQLWDTLHQLSAFSPRFVSVTYGAGGSSRALTQQTTATIGRTYAIPTAAHLTCVGMSKPEIMTIAQDYRAAGIRQIVALRGDPPKGQSAFIPYPRGYESVCDLITDLRNLGFDEVFVAAYPEVHPEAANREADLDWLKRKLDAGATAAISQFFFDAETFLRFRERCATAGIDQPLIPGILPIENWKNTRQFALRCGAKIPKALDRQFDNAAKIDAHDVLSVAVAVDLCAELMSEGVDQLHFYTLNKPALTYDTCLALGIPAKLDFRLAA